MTTTTSTSPYPVRRSQGGGVFILIILFTIVLLATIKVTLRRTRLNSTRTPRRSLAIAFKRTVFGRFIRSLGRRIMSSIGCAKTQQPVRFLTWLLRRSMKVFIRSALLSSQKEASGKQSSAGWKANAGANGTTRQAGHLNL